MRLTTQVDKASMFLHVGDFGACHMQPFPHQNHLLTFHGSKYGSACTTGYNLEDDGGMIGDQFFKNIQQVALCSLSTLSAIRSTPDEADAPW